MGAAAGARDVAGAEWPRAQSCCLRCTGARHSPWQSCAASFPRKARLAGATTSGHSCGSETASTWRGPPVRAGRRALRPGLTAGWRRPGSRSEAPRGQDGRRGFPAGLARQQGRVRHQPGRVELVVGVPRAQAGGPGGRRTGKQMPAKWS